MPTRHRSLAARAASASRVALGLLAGIVLNACTVGPDYAGPPDSHLPADWPEPAASPAEAAAESQILAEARPGEAPAAAPLADTTVSPDLSRWWNAFADPQLDALIETALADNLDLQRAEARVLQARALRTLVGAADDPQVNAGASAIRSQNSGNAAGTVDPGRTRTLYDVGFDASWELDLFGGVRRAEEAADAGVAAAEENRRDVLVTLIAEVSREYLDLRSAQRRLKISEENLAAQADTLELTRVRAQSGLGSDLDVARSEAQWAFTSATVPEIEVTLHAALHRLDVLLGRPAGSGAEQLLPDQPLPLPPPRVPVGLPSDLLRRRPDIRAAERELAQATANIGVATADLYPRFSLTASYGRSSDATSNLFSRNSRFWSLGPGLSWPVLDGGAIRANIAIQDAQAQDAMLRYRQVVLAAFAEVADALVAYGREQDRRDTLAASVAAQVRATDLATQLNEAGMTDFLDVLQAQSSKLIAENLLALSERDLSADFVALCKALGGGWDIAPDAPAEMRGAPETTDDATADATAGADANASAAAPPTGGEVAATVSP